MELTVIDNSKPFNPSKFISKGYTVWRGPIDGDGMSEDEKEDKDERSLTLNEFDFSKIKFLNCLGEGEEVITGEEKLRRLKDSGLIRLGGNAFQSLWLDYKANKENSALEWIYRNQKVIYIDFFGLILRGPEGNRCVFYLSRGRTGWRWGCTWGKLSTNWSAGSLSAVLDK